MTEGTEKTCLGREGKVDSACGTLVSETNAPVDRRAHSCPRGTMRIGE